MSIKYYIKLKENNLLIDSDLQRLVTTIEMLKDKPSNIEVKECSEEEVAELNNRFYLKEDIKKELAEKEKEELNHIKIDKITLAEGLKSMYGIGYNELMEKIKANEDALAEWELCKDGKIERCSKLFTFINLGLKKKELDKLFKKLAC